jgi:BirA family transcriptional regulator, biotin operon repressor / biotin---[acetyl-CoA-carboxylase] ligase
MPFDLVSVRSQLPGRLIEWHDVAASTMAEARRLASAGAPSGTVVGAEEQTAGQGRLGRTWHSEPASGLYVSMILRRSFPPATLPVVTLALGLAARQAIWNATGLACDLRWPNDLLVESKKCAGILTQLESSVIIAGIGINVNHSSFPTELQNTATSLRIANGRAQSRERLLVELLPAIDGHCDLLEHHGIEAIIEAFTRASSYVWGRRVCVDQDGAELRGTTAGLNNSGFLNVRDDQGHNWVILAGGVRPCS